jgi:hypothetical protein
VTVPANVPVAARSGMPVGAPGRSGVPIPPPAASVTAPAADLLAMAPPPPAAPVSARVIPCTFCRKGVPEPDVNYFHGDLACPACYHQRVAEEVDPMVTCEKCGAATAQSASVRFEGKRYCPDCAEAERIAFNLQMQTRRAALAASSRFSHGGPPKARGRAAVIASAAGALIVLAVAGTLFYTLYQGVAKTKPETFTVVEGNGALIQLPRDLALQKLREDREVTLVRNGMRVSRDDAFRMLAQ